MVLHCFTDEFDTFVAETVEEAFSLCIEYHGGNKEEYDIKDWEKIPDAEMVPIIVEENLENRTAYEWALINDKGFLCSAESLILEWHESDLFKQKMQELINNMYSDPFSMPMISLEDCMNKRFNVLNKNTSEKE